MSTADTYRQLKAWGYDSETAADKLGMDLEEAEAIDYGHAPVPSAEPVNEFNLAAIRASTESLEAWLKEYDAEVESDRADLNSAIERGYPTYGPFQVDDIIERARFSGSITRQPFKLQASFEMGAPMRAHNDAVKEAIERNPPSHDRPGSFFVVNSLNQLPGPLRRDARSYFADIPRSIAPDDMAAFVRVFNDTNRKTDDPAFHDVYDSLRNWRAPRAITLGDDEVVTRPLRESTRFEGKLTFLTPEEEYGQGIRLSRPRKPSNASTRQQSGQQLLFQYMVAPGAHVMFLGDSATSLPLGTERNLRADIDGQGWNAVGIFDTQPERGGRYNLLADIIPTTTDGTDLTGAPVDLHGWGELAAERLGVEYPGRHYLYNPETDSIERVPYDYLKRASSEALQRHTTNVDTRIESIRQALSTIAEAS